MVEAWGEMVVLCMGQDCQWQRGLAGGRERGVGKGCLAFVCWMGWVACL